MRFIGGGLRTKNKSLVRGKSMAETTSKTSACDNCPYSSVIEELQRDSDRNSSQHREFYSRFQKIETAQAVSDEKYANLLLLMTEVKNSVNELKEKPAKRLDSITTYIITCLIGLVVGFLFNMLIK